LKKGLVAKIFSLGVLAFMLAILIALVLFLAVPPMFVGQEKQVAIPKGASFKKVVEILDEQGLVRSRTGFYLLARMMGVTGRVQAGEYELSTAMLPPVILRKLVKGDVMKYQVIIPEGYTIRQVADRLAEMGIIEGQEEFLSLAFSANFAAGLGIEGKNVEGYLFPDTYFFPKGIAPAEVIKIMVEKFGRVYGLDFSERAAELGMTDRQIVILASIIEKETGNPAERPLVSAVFYNRLKRGIPLCSDPTVIYGIKDFNGNLRKRDLARMTPYNTYLMRGLPPGPIANPGRSAMMAALYPAPVDYLYFVSRNDGTHHFSSTLREHNEAVWRYQKRRVSR
jgi:UPF0755 protein